MVRGGLLAHLVLLRLVLLHLVYLHLGTRTSPWGGPTGDFAPAPPPMSHEPVVRLSSKTGDLAPAPPPMSHAPLADVGILSVGH